jgi:hypothetical protein
MPLSSPGTPFSFALPPAVSLSSDPPSFNTVFYITYKLGNPTEHGEKMSVKTEEVTKRVMDLVIDGAGLWVGRKVSEFLKPYTKRTLREYNDAVIKIGLSFIDVVLPKIKEVPYVRFWLQLWGRDGVSDVLKVVVDKATDCWATDPNTIHCVNFDALPDAVYIDGTKKARDTDYTVSGAPEDFDILLKTALTSGAHDLVVAGLRKSFSGKIYV